MASEVKLKMHRLAVFCVWISLIGLIECEKSSKLLIYPVSSVQRKPVGKSLMLTCKPDVHDVNLVTDLKWRDNKNNTIYPKAGGQPAPPMYTEVLANEQSLALFIPKLEETMAGWYYCSAFYANTEQMDIGVKIETFVPITWKNAPEEQYPTKGDDYLVKCEVTANPPPAVDWLRNGDQVKTGDRFVVDSRGLMIRNVQLEDDGFYTCRAVVIDTGELQERVIKVGVQIRPHVLTLPQQLEAIEGHPFSFKCNATGKPPPKVEWIKDRTQQNLATADRFIVDEITGQMTISRVADDDYGTYTCVATNAAGIAQSKTMLNVLVKPKIYELYNITVSRQDKGEIICKATGRPAPLITFRRWGSEEEFATGPQVYDDRITLEETRDQQRGESTGILQITNIERTDDGLYQCVSRNKGGESFRTGHITVEYPPSFEHMKNLPPVYSWQQRRANLSCLAQGFPNATIEWKIGEKLVKDMLDSNMEIEGTGPRSSLLIKPKGPQYYRAYRCVARNKLGEDTHIMELREARVPDAVTQAIPRVVTATTVTFDIFGPSFEVGMPILAYHVQYKEERQIDWNSAFNRTWSVDSPYIVEGLLPERSYTFRFAARNQVGVGNWGAHKVQSTPKRSFPEPPKLLHQPEVVPDPGEDPIVASPYSDKFDLRWTTPHDNGERIDYFNVKYCEGQKINGVWTELEQMCQSQQINVLEGTNLELRDLKPETAYRVELRAHNAIGLSEPSSLLLKTARGHDVAPVPHPHLISSAVIVGITAGGVIVLLILIDLLCCAFANAGIFAMMCRRTKRSPSDLDDENKIGSLYGWRFPLPYCSGSLIKERPPSPLPLPPPIVKLGDYTSMDDEKQPLSTTPTNSIKKNSSVEFDGRVVHSRSGEILGKNSAV